MAWVKWDSLESFNAWHDNLKAELGLPRLSVDAAGDVVPDSVINESYTLPVIVSDSDIRSNIAQEYASGLNPSESPYVSNYES